MSQEKEVNKGYTIRMSERTRELVNTIHGEEKDVKRPQIIENALEFYVKEKFPQVQALNEMMESLKAKLNDGTATVEELQALLTQES